MKLDMTTWTRTRKHGRGHGYMDEDMETWRHGRGEMETWKHGDMARRHGDLDTWRHGHENKTWTHEDTEIWRQGHMKTQRYGDKDT